MVLSIFCFHPFKKGCVSLQTHGIFHPVWRVQMAMVQQEWQGGRAGSLMEAIFDCNR